MEKKLINEDIQNIKYLFGYKPGRVISEQDIDYTTDDFLNTTEMDEEDIDESFGNENEIFEQEEPENDRYMFFSNLEQIHRQMGILLEKDPEMIRSILENGHDWAQDHIATAKESIDQVFDFIMNEENGDDNEEMFEGYEYDDENEINPDDFEDDNQYDLNQLKQKHGIKFRDEFDGDDEFMDYMSDNKDSFDNFRKENNRIKIPTDPIVFEPNDDEISQLKQKRGVKFRDEFEGDDEFMDYIQNNRGSFNNLSKDLNDLRQTKRNR
jgi:hypothetical protein